MATPDLSSVNVDKDTYVEWQAYVLQKHHKLRGVMHEETATALREYMKNNPVKGG